VQLQLIEWLALEAPLRALIERGDPVLATCAGLILLAREVESPAQKSFGVLDVSVRRNAWGRQLDSFEAKSDDQQRDLIFIRAPRIVRTGEGVEVLARYRGEPVLVRDRNVTAASFHPELAAGASVHFEVFGRGTMVEPAAAQQPLAAAET
jgi:5'-phosphate synthase pdxT subunit